jgi:hypothetical protein
MIVSRRRLWLGLPWRCNRLGGPPFFVYEKMMDGSISHTEKRGRGRPRIGAKGIHVALPPDQLTALDAFRSSQEDDPSRPEALRRLAAEGLKAKGFLKAE